MKKTLEKLNACNAALEWVGDKTWEECYNTCERGDWLLWLFQKTNPDDLQFLTLAKGHCANTVRHLMKDERSIKAVDAAIAFGEGKITEDELDAAYAAAAHAADAADAAAAASASATADAYAADAYADAAAYAAAAAHAAAAADAAAAVDAAAYAAAVDAAAYAAAAAAAINRQETADICRKYLPINIWNLI